MICILMDTVAGPRARAVGQEAIRQEAHHSKPDANAVTRMRTLQSMAVTLVCRRVEA